MNFMTNMAESVFGDKKAQQSGHGDNSSNTANTSIEASTNKNIDVGDHVNDAAHTSNSFATTLTFGPPGRQWRFDTITKTYDLTRNLIGNSYTFKTTHGPEGVSVKLASGKTALVVIDMQNYFLHPSLGGHPKGLASAKKLKLVLQRAREADIQVSITLASITNNRFLM